MLNELSSLAGQLLGMQFSFSLVNLLDPNSEVQTPLLAQMLSLLEITVLLAIGFIGRFSRRCFTHLLVVPLGSGLAPREIGLPLVGMMSGVFLAALQLAAPVMPQLCSSNRRCANVACFAATAGTGAHSAGEDSSRIRGARRVPGTVACLFRSALRRLAERRPGAAA